MYKGDENEGDHATGSERAQKKRSLPAIELLKAGPGIANADATLQELVGALIEGAVAVPDFNFETMVCDASEDLDQVRAFVHSDAVTNGVFNERLQKERRDWLIEGGRISMNFDGKAIAEALALNADVEVEELEFARERNYVLVHLVEGNSKKLTEPEKHILSGTRIFLHEGNGSLKGVEEEMGLNLHTQRLKLSRGQAGFELRLIQFALTDLLLKMKKYCDGNDDPIGEDSQESAHQRFFNERGPGCSLFECVGVEEAAGTAEDRLDGDAADAGNAVRIEDALWPVEPGERKAECEGEDQRSKKSPWIPVERGPGEVVMQRQDVTARRIVHENLGTLQSDNNAPQRKGDGQLFEVSVQRELLRKPSGADRNG